jgi:hypothetical protein
MMKKLIATATMALLLGCTATVFAQHEHEGHAAPAGKPAAAPHAAPHASGPTYGGSYHGGMQRNNTWNNGVHPSGVPQHVGQVRSGFVQSRAGNWDREHHNWGERGGYNGYRIPERRFHDYYGHDHFFRIHGLPILFVGGYPRFQYDGYWVTFVDPWPESWDANWWDSDDVYIDYVNDGYYLYSRRHPGIGLAVSIGF